MGIVEVLNGKAYSKQGVYHGYKTHASIKRVIAYITDLRKTNENLIKGLNCSAQNAYEEFVLNKTLWDKTENGKRRMVTHMVQGFDPEDELTPEVASEIAEKFLKHEIFRGFQVVYATHIDTGKLHTHFIIDTCNTETGKQWHLSKAELQKLKDYSDELCREYKLSICQKKEHYTVPHRRKNEVEVLKQGGSWKEEIRIAATICAQSAISRADFIRQMRELGFGVTWKDEHKYIVFSDQAGHRVRHHRLEPAEAFTKEALLEQFRLNKQALEIQRAEAVEEQRKDMEAYQGFRSFLYAAKTLVQMADQPYPLQNHDAFKGIGTQAAMREYAAEQKKGRGYER